jgi:sugar O-acyltransferase (sialic acid O-acetyltransferase NeuD family)
MNKKSDILLIGGGGHCKACIDVIEAVNKYRIVGIVDVHKKIGEKVLGYPIIDSDENLEKLFQSMNNAFITVGHIKSSELRVRLFGKAKTLGAYFPVIISPKAHLSKHSKIGEGTIIMHGTVVNADVEIGYNTIINNLSLVEHDSVIGNHTHISTGSRINGNCRIGNNCFIGSGTVINQGVDITDGVIIGSGSLVRKDINELGVYAGNPLKKYK